MTPWSARQVVLLEGELSLNAKTRQRRRLLRKVLADRAEVLQRDEIGPPVMVRVVVPLPGANSLAPAGSLLSLNLLHATALSLIGAVEPEGELDPKAVKVVGTPPGPGPNRIEWASRFRKGIEHRVETRAPSEFVPNMRRFKRH